MNKIGVVIKNVNCVAHSHFEKAKIFTKYMYFD